MDDSRLSPPELVGPNLFFINAFDSDQAFTEREHRDWLAEAGLEGPERSPLPDSSGLATGIKSTDC